MEIFSQMYLAVNLLFSNCTYCKFKRIFGPKTTDLWLPATQHTQLPLSVWLHGTYQTVMSSKPNVIQKKWECYPEFLKWNPTTATRQQPVEPPCSNKCCQRQWFNLWCWWFILLHTEAGSYLTNQINSLMIRLDSRQQRLRIDMFRNSFQWKVTVESAGILGKMTHASEELSEMWLWIIFAGLESPGGTCR